MIYELPHYRDILLKKDEFNFFSKDLPKICDQIINDSNNKSKECLFDLFSKYANVERTTNEWYRKYHLFLLHLLYINEYILVDTTPIRLQKI